MTVTINTTSGSAEVVEKQDIAPTGFVCNASSLLEPTVQKDDTLNGNGSTANPLSVNLSGDVGNILGLGTDGGLLATGGDVTCLQNAAGTDAWCVEDDWNFIGQRPFGDSPPRQYIGTYTNILVLGRTANDPNADLGAAPDSLITLSRDNLVLETGGTSEILLIARGNASIDSYTNNILRWVISETGHYIPGADNAYDIGEPNRDIRNLYLGSGIEDANDSFGTANQVLTSDGSGNAIWADATETITSNVIVDCVHTDTREDGTVSNYKTLPVGIDADNATELASVFGSPVGGGCPTGKELTCGQVFIGNAGGNIEASEVHGVVGVVPTVIVGYNPNDPYDFVVAEQFRHDRPITFADLPAPPYAAPCGLKWVARVSVRVGLSLDIDDTTTTFPERGITVSTSLTVNGVSGVNGGPGGGEWTMSTNTTPQSPQFINLQGMLTGVFDVNQAAPTPVLANFFISYQNGNTWTIGGVGVGTGIAGRGTYNMFLAKI